MKIRNGFVSNSSSASFIVKWRPKKDGEAQDSCSLANLEDYLQILLGGYMEEPFREGIVSRTNFIHCSQTGKWYETCDYTHMMNSVDDFHREILTLYYLLSENKENFEFEHKIIDEG